MYYLKHAEIVNYWTNRLDVPSDAFTQKGSSFFYQEDEPLNGRIAIYRNEETAIVIIPELCKRSIAKEVAKFPLNEVANADLLMKHLKSTPVSFCWRDKIYYLNPELLRFVASKAMRIMTNRDEVDLIELLNKCSKREQELGKINIDNPIVVGYYESESLIAAASLIFEENSLIADVGVLVEPSFRRQNIATQLVQFLCCLGMKQNKIIQYTTMESNRASVKVAEKSGFQLYLIEEGLEIVQKPN